MKAWISALLATAALALAGGLSTLLPLPLSLTPAVAVLATCFVVAPLGFFHYRRQGGGTAVKLRSVRRTFPGGRP